MNLLLLFATSILALIAANKIREFLRLKKDTQIHIQTIQNFLLDRRKDLISEIDYLRTYFSDWHLVTMADRYSWPSYIISCLPKLYFVNSKTKEVYVWKEVIKLLPSAYKYQKTREICEGAILKITCAEGTFQVLNEIALRLEDVRLNSPFSSDASLYGAINQSISEYELKMEKENNLVLAHQIQTQRKELLSNKLHIDILTAN